MNIPQDVFSPRVERNLRLVADHAEVDHADALRDARMEMHNFLIKYKRPPGEDPCAVVAAVVLAEAMDEVDKFIQEEGEKARNG